MATSRTLLCGLNWVGDSIMAMPALHDFVSKSVSSVSVLAKPGLVPLWSMMPGIEDVHALSPGTYGTLATGLRLRREHFDEAYVLPNSFRSAFIPFVAGVPKRVGVAGQHRGWLLTHRWDRPTDPRRYHQAWEYVHALLPSYKGDRLPTIPKLELDPSSLTIASEWLGDRSDRWVGLVPGAARGPSKRWPPKYFATVGKRLVDEEDCRIVVMGSVAEKLLCSEVVEAIGPSAIDLAGRTTLSSWAAVLAACDVVIANDSGGMHLACAMGTSVVAIYGQTDPQKTGPLGPATIVQRSDVRNRRIARDSEAARLSLASILPNEVYEAAQHWLAGEAGFSEGA